IRDVHVTGVQTWWSSDLNYDPNDPFAHLRKRVDEDRNVGRYIANILEGSARALYATFTDPDENESPETQAMRYAIARVQEGGGRSEERRVGKGERLRVLD